MENAGLLQWTPVFLEVQVYLDRCTVLCYNESDPIQTVKRKGSTTMTPRLPKQFGMFIHFGPYAISGWHEQLRMRRGISRADYAKTAMTFSPTASPRDWVRLAKEAGMEYICFTTKHHDGFCMWDTKQTDFNITKTCGRDILYALADACAKEDMALSLYYSIPDWNHPAAYNERSTHQCPKETGDIPDTAAYRDYVRAQVKELLSGYGSIYTWFWDIPPKIDDPSMNDLVRSLMPGIYINDRGYSVDGQPSGDFSTPERSVPDGCAFERLTEACQSVGAESWGYRADEDYFTPAFLCQSMAKIFVMGGSYLLNVGPDANGDIPVPAQCIVRRCGGWYKAVREAFSPVCTPCADLTTPAYLVSRADDRTYYLCTRTPLQSTGLSLSGFARAGEDLPREITCLNSGKPVDFSHDILPSDHMGGFGENREPKLHLYRLSAEEALPLVFRIRY